MCLSSFGGSARIATELALQLAQRDYQIHLFSRSTPFGRWNHDASGITLHRIMQNGQNGLHPAQLYTNWSAQEFEAMLSRLLHVIEGEGLDILHFHYGVPFAFLAAAVKQRLGPAGPLIAGTLHGTDVSAHGKDPIIGPKLARTLGHIDRLTTVSASHADLIVEVLGLSARPEIIPNFVDLAKFRPHHLNQTGLRNRTRPRIVHLSNFRAVKDSPSMARIFLSLRQEMETELWLIGDGPGMNSVKAILRAGTPEKNVRYWGLQRQVAPLLAQTDLLLVTSLSESFCLVVLEAMACGVPVLATNVGGLPEVVKHGQTGFLFPVGEHEVAMRLAVGLLSDPIRHQEMRVAAVQHARQFGAEQIVPAYEDFYQRLSSSKIQTSEVLEDSLAGKKCLNSR